MGAPLQTFHSVTSSKLVVCSALRTKMYAQRIIMGRGGLASHPLHTQGSAGSDAQNAIAPKVRLELLLNAEQLLRALAEAGVARAHNLLSRVWSVRASFCPKLPLLLRPW